MMTSAFSNVTTGYKWKCFMVRLCHTAQCILINKCKEMHFLISLCTMYMYCIQYIVALPDWFGSRVSCYGGRNSTNAWPDHPALSPGVHIAPMWGTSGLCPGVHIAPMWGASGAGSASQPGHSMTTENYTCFHFSLKEPKHWWWSKTQLPWNEGFVINYEKVHFTKHAFILWSYNICLTFPTT